MRHMVMSGVMIFVTILIAMSIAHMEIGRGMMVIRGRVIGFMMIRLWMIGLRMIGFIVMIRFMMIRLWMMIRLMMVGFAVIRVYMVWLRVVDTMMTQGAQAVELRAMSMNFPKKSKVRPG